MFKKVLYTVLFFAIIGGIAATIGYQRIFGTNTKHNATKLIQIPTGSTFEDVVYILDTSKILMDQVSFGQVSNLMKYTDRIKPGQYLIEPGLNNRELIGLLRAGRQKPVKLTFSTARTIGEIAGHASKKIEADSNAILRELLRKDRLEELQLNEVNIISRIIPNTYEVFWDMNPEEFASKMEREYASFWEKGDRIKKCEALGMSQHEVSILASIVEKESIQKEERATIAGVYLNRIERDIPLQADPTVVFGIGDFTIRRVLNKHLAQDTPYNTYMHEGLPPGPICMPSISSIDAVLNAEKHDYIFFCAKPGYNGSHLFAKTNAEHERNARVYHRWLNSEGIKG